MRRSDRVWRLIVILFAVLGWGMVSADSAPQETPPQTETEKEKEEKDSDKKDADEKDADEKDPARDSQAERAARETERAARAADAKKERSKKSESSAGEETKNEDADGTQTDAARKQAAEVVVRHLKAAAEAIGLRGAPAEAPAAKLSSSVGDGGETATSVEKRRKKKKKKNPAPPMFRMRDGTRIAGQAELDVLRIDTAYGPLEVPIAEIVHVRFSSPQDSRVGERVAELVEQLASDEFDLREEATEELRGIGLPALEALRRAAKSDDQEVKTRAEKLIVELEEELEDIEEDREPYLIPLPGDEDEVVTVKFTAFGRIDVSHFSVKTPYGQLKLHRDDVLSIVFREPPFRQLTFQVGGSKSYAGNDKWLETGLKLTQGTFLKITAAGSLNLANYGTNSNPDGVTNVPANGLDSFPVGALVARIGSKGKPFLVGAEYEGTANATGDLQLGISFKSGSTRGQYQVEVEVKIEEE